MLFELTYYFVYVKNFEVKKKELLEEVVLEVHIDSDVKKKDNWIAIIWLAWFAKNHEDLSIQDLYKCSYTISTEE